MHGKMHRMASKPIHVMEPFSPCIKTILCQISYRPKGNCRSKRKRQFPRLIYVYQTAPFVDTTSRQRPRFIAIFLIKIGFMEWRRVIRSTVVVVFIELKKLFVCRPIIEISPLATLVGIICRATETRPDIADSYIVAYFSQHPLHNVGVEMAIIVYNKQEIFIRLLPGILIPHRKPDIVFDHFFS